MHRASPTRASGPLAGRTADAAWDRRATASGSTTTIARSCGGPGEGRQLGTDSGWLEDPQPRDPEFGDGDAFAAHLDALASAGQLEPPDEDEISWRDWLTAPDPEETAGPLSRVDELDWEMWATIDRDEVESLILEERAPAWMRLPPGAALAAALEGVRCADEDPVGLIEVMKAASRMVAWAESVKVAAVAEFYRRRRREAAEARAMSVDRYVDNATGRPVDPMRGTAAEIAAALRLAPATVVNHIDNALRLTRDLPDTYRALRCGAVSLSKTLCVLDATAHLPVDKQQIVEERVLPRAPKQTQTQLRASLRRAVARVDTRELERRHRDAVAERVCYKQQLPDGTAGIWFTHSADKVEAAWAAIQGMSELAKFPGDQRTADQRRADVVADVFGQILSNGTDWLDRKLPDQHRRRPHIEVVVPASTLLCLDDEPAELSGYGPIPADVARRIAADGTWRRLLTDPATGVVLEASTRRHDPAANVSETLLARNPVCNWIGCTKPARECDRDHGEKFRRTGETKLEDLRPYCEYHHKIKDDETSGWQVENLADGSTRFTAPTGHVYRSVPPPRGPVTVPRGPNTLPRSATADPVDASDPPTSPDLDPPPF